MENKILVSVIIPVYNSENYLRQCLDSVVNQTLLGIEIICVDDGSTDGSLAILREYEAMDSRVHVLTQPNINAGAARNAGLDIAAGEFIYFIDSDDFAETDLLERVRNTMTEEKSDVAVFSAYEYNTETEETREMPWSLRLNRCPAHSPFSPAENTQYLFNSFQNWPWNKLFRRTLIEKYHLRFQSVQRTNDMAFVSCALALAESISVISHSFIYYRVGRETSLQSTNASVPTAFWEAYLETARRLKSYGMYDRYEQSFLNAVLSGTFYNLNSVKKNGTAYRDILNIVKYKADDAFGFSSHDSAYYYDKSCYEEFLALKRTPEHLPADIPVVSVIMPSLNVRPFIRECIESVIEQTLQGIEIICVDAGSTDGTLEILEEYAERDKRITILRSERKSYGYQMNLGIDAASGEYIGIVETDDYILPTMFEELYEIAHGKSLDICKGDFQRFWGENEDRRFEYVKVSKDNYYDQILNVKDNPQILRCNGLNQPGIYSLRFLRAKDIRFNESPGASYQDNGFWFQATTQAARVYYVNKSFYMLRRDNPGSSVNFVRNMYSMCEEYDYIREFLRKHPDLETRFAPTLAYYRMGNYLFILRRIAPENRLEFLKRFSQDFRELNKAGELDDALYSDDQWQQIQDIMECPEYVYYRDWYKPERVEAQRVLANQREQQFKDLQKQLHDVRHSVSFRLGRLLTFLPRKFRGGMRCLREHGMVYTVNRLLFHLGLLKKKTEK